MNKRREEAQQRFQARLGIDLPLTLRVKQLEREREELLIRLAEQSDALVELAELIAGREDND